MRGKSMIALFVYMALTGCASDGDTEYAKSMLNPNPDTVEDRVDIHSTIDAVYCGQTGFAKFHESKRYFTFTCKDHGVFRVPK